MRKVATVTVMGNVLPYVEELKKLHFMSVCGFGLPLKCFRDFGITNICTEEIINNCVREVIKAVSSDSRVKITVECKEWEGSPIDLETFYARRGKKASKRAKGQ